MGQPGVRFPDPNSCPGLILSNLEAKPWGEDGMGRVKSNGSASPFNERKINALYTWILRYSSRHESKALQSTHLSRNTGLLELREFPLAKL